MTAEQLEENLQDNYITLKRQYILCCDKYDRASLKLLAHALRLWADMKNQTDDFLLKNKPDIIFSDFSLKSETKKIIRNGEFILTCFPILVSARMHTSVKSNSGTIMQGPFGLKANPDMVAACDPVFNEPNIVTLSRFTVVYNKLTKEQINQIVNISFDSKDVSFGIWLDNLAIHISLKDSLGSIEKQYITRSILINRMANARGGSHPQGAEESHNKYDRIINDLFDYTALEMPLPYLILLSIAKEIVIRFSFLESNG